MKIEKQETTQDDILTDTRYIIYGSSSHVPIYLCSLTKKELKNLCKIIKNKFPEFLK